MKRKLLPILLLLVCASLSAQTIAFRKDQGDELSVGTNFMITSFFVKYNTGTALSIFTSKATGMKRIILGLYFQTYGLIYTQKHSKAIFKTFSGNVITLEQLDKTRDSESSRERVGDFDSNIFSLKVNYNILEEELSALMKEGVATLRIETSVGFKDYNYDKDYLGGFILSEYNLIQDKKSFDKDF